VIRVVSSSEPSPGCGFGLAFGGGHAPVSDQIVALNVAVRPIYARSETEIATGQGPQPIQHGHVGATRLRAHSVKTSYGFMTGR
jgi:hypothetical protein